MEGLQKSSPPLEKGRRGGIYEPPFQKTKVMRKMQNANFWVHFQTGDDSFSENPQAFFNFQFDICNLQ